MAVVQISKIQVRRGQKNSNSGIPQLSSAEFAWAVDSQELFIGNGSVLEGAPYVGNTKILTEHDNILELASSYQFAHNDTSITLSVPRELQYKLDEYVSVADFGAVGDGSTDCVTAFETAFTQLFRNVDENYRKVLLVPNGEYLFLTDIRIPSGVILRGETELGVVLNISSHNVRFITSDGKEIADFTSTNRPTNVTISNLTIKRTTGQLVLSGLGSSTLDSVKFKGEYSLGNTVSSLTTEPSAVVWNNDIEGIKVTDITFKSCTFEANSINIKCVQTVAFDTTVKFDNCRFFISDTAIYIVGVTENLITGRYQDNKWQINDCEFEEVANQAFRSTYGRGTLIQRCKFKTCGTSTNLASSPTDAIVYFGQKINNVVIDCTSDRQQAAGVVTSSSVASVVEVYNADRSNFVDRNYSVIYYTVSFRPLAVISALNKYYKINYFLSLDVFSRIGTLTITVGDNLSQVSISDEYQYSPNTITPLPGSDGGAIMTNFEFNAELKDNDGDSGIETILLSYKNPSSGITGNISFDVAYGV